MVENSNTKGLSKYSDAYSGGASVAQYYPKPTNVDHPVASKVINFLGDVATVLGNTPESGNIFAGVNALMDKKSKQRFMVDYNKAVQKDIQDEQKAANFVGSFGHDQGIIKQSPQHLISAEKTPVNDPEHFIPIAGTSYGMDTFNYPRNLNIDTIEKMGNMVSGSNAADYTNNVINSGGKIQDLPTGDYSYVKQSDLSGISDKQIDAMAKYAESLGLQDSIQSGFDSGQNVFKKNPSGINVGNSGNMSVGNNSELPDASGNNFQLSAGVSQNDNSGIADIPFFAAPRASNEGFKSGYEVSKGGAIDYPKSQSEIFQNYAGANRDNSYANLIDRTPQLSYPPQEHDYEFQNILNTAKVYDDTIGQVGGQIQSLEKIYFSKDTKEKDRKAIKNDIDSLRTRQQTLQSNRDALTQQIMGRIGGVSAVPGVSVQTPPVSGATNTATGSYNMPLSAAAQNYLINRNNK